MMDISIAVKSNRCWKFPVNRSRRKKVEKNVLFALKNIFEKFLGILNHCSLRNWGFWWEACNFVDITRTAYALSTVNTAKSLRAQFRREFLLLHRAQEGKAPGWSKAFVRITKPFHRTNEALLLRHVENSAANGALNNNLRRMCYSRHSVQIIQVQIYCICF